MMSCREASRLVSERRERELSLGERIGLRFHLAMCFLCRRYADQIDFLHDIAHSLGHLPHDELPSGVMPHGAALSADAKERLKKSLLDSQ